MADDLAQLHSIAASLVEQLEPAQQRRLAFRMAIEMRKANQRRMAAQKAPDGKAWAKRRPRAKAKPAERPVRFLYPAGGGGEPRLVDMRSWLGRGAYLIGFDREAGAMRTFQRDRVIKWITPEGSAGQDGLPVRPRKARPPSMFRGLRTGRHLKAGANGQGGWVEFTERASRIAFVHHEGRRDRVAPNGPEVDYPQRELLGFSAGDEAMLLNMFIDNAGDALGWGRRAGR